MSGPTHVKQIIPPEVLGNDHLIEAVAGNACVRELVATYGLPELADMSSEELRAQGITPAAARRLTCAFELARRMSHRVLEPGVRLRNTSEIVEAFQGRLREEKREHFIVVLLNAKNYVIRDVTVSVGILTASLIHPREVFLPAIRHAAAGIVLLHQHPSGDPEPSPEDHEVTRRLVAVGELIGIRVLDHVVIAGGNGAGYVSFLERGQI